MRLAAPLIMAAGLAISLSASPDASDAFPAIRRQGFVEAHATLPGGRRVETNAVVIVVSMRLVGALLVSALLVFPAVTAMRLCKSFRSVTIAAALLGTLGALAGILVAILAGTPVGSTIVVANLLLFALCSLAARFRP